VVAVDPVAAPLTVDLAQQRFAVVDVETSGLSPDHHRILQVAVVEVHGDGRVVDEWSTLLRPSLWRVGPRHVHGLTVRRLRRAPRLASVVPELVDRLDGRIVVAHNAAFDWAFLAHALERARYRVADDPLRLCTLELSRSLDPEREQSHRLADVCQRHGVPLQQAHDALADARATALLLPHLLAASGARTLADLAPAMQGASTRWVAGAR
jgi:DNA polymerase-3 subunit epsilon